MKKLLFLISFITLAHISYSQEVQGNGEFRSILLSSIHVIPADSLNKVYYTYRLPYNRLVFEKKGEIYNAHYSIAVEILDSTEKFIVRSFDDEKISTGNFESTDSKSEYIQGMIDFSLGIGSYTIIPILTDKNSNREIKLKPEHLVLSRKTSSEIFRPLIVDEEKVSYNGEPQYVLTNYEENFPFAEKKFNLIIPVSDLNTKALNVAIINEADTIYQGLVSESYVSGTSLKLDDNKIFLADDNAVIKTRNFIIRDFSNKLKVGGLYIAVSMESSTNTAADTKTKLKKPDKIFQKSVLWYDKPYSLYNPEEAIKSLKGIEDPEVIDKLLDADEDDYFSELFNYWKKYDPTPETIFNPLMDQFYTRVDYALRNFATIAGKSGVKSDRGQIFIRFGKPQKVERNSNDHGKIVETWVYENPQRKFIFVDEKGTGDFSLTKG